MTHGLVWWRSGRTIRVLRTEYVAEQDCLISTLSNLGICDIESDNIIAENCPAIYYRPTDHYVTGLISVENRLARFGTLYRMKTSRDK